MTPERQVRVVEYSLHLTDGSIRTKFGSPLLIRPSQKRWSLLAWLVHEASLHLCSADVLSEFLKHFNIRLPKSSTKNTKVRRLLTLEEVTSQCPPEEITRVEEVLQELEEKRKKNRKEGDQNAQEQEEDEEAVSSDS